MTIEEIVISGVVLGLIIFGARIAVKRLLHYISEKKKARMIGRTKL